MAEKNYLRLIAKGYQKELSRVAEFIENIKAGVANYYFLNFFALEGFAKTSLLQTIWDTYERILPGSFVQITQFRRKHEPFALYDLLIHILNELSFRLPKRIADLPSDYKISTDERWLSEMIINLVANIKDVEKVILLLLDDYDAMPADLRERFETTILSPLGKTKHVAVILTSELELKFTERFDLRMRLDRYELSSLTAEAISHSFPQYKALAPDIHRITGGLPILAGELVYDLEADDVTPDYFHSHKQELIRKYYRTHVDETLFKYVSQKEKETLLVLALLRRFDVKVLGKILSKILPKYYKEYGPAEYLNLIEVLGGRVQWRLQGGYAVNVPLRIVLQGYVLVENLQLYERVHRAATVLYQELLKKEYREHYLIELVYHVVVLEVRKKSGLPQIQARIKEEVQQYINGDTAARMRETDLDSLRNSLKKDPDLEDYISENVLQPIQELLHKKINEKSVRKIA